MNIVTRSKFLTLPRGTVYSDYRPAVFTDLCIKEDSILHYNDFRTTSILDAVDADSSEDRFDLLDEAISDSDVVIPLDFNEISRDALYDNEAMFAVWSREDVQALIVRLNEALADSSEVDG